MVVLTLSSLAKEPTPTRLRTHHSTLGVGCPDAWQLRVTGSSGAVILDSGLSRMTGGAL